MYSIFFVFATLVGGGMSANVNRRMKLLAELDNHIDSNVVTSKRFINLTRRPAPRLLHQAGTTLELNCEAIAAPAPSVHWFKNDAPIFEYDKESNEIMDTNAASVGRLSSTLLVSRAERAAQYSCLVIAGGLTARASTIVYSADGSTDTMERSKLIPLAPRILVSYKVFVDTIGNNVVLPCRARGHPRPLVSWTDNNGIDVKRNPRMTVLRSGELVISPLHWSDMGEFSCHASNMFGNADIKTFVYPARLSVTDNIILSYFGDGRPRFRARPPDSQPKHQSKQSSCC